MTFKLNEDDQSMLDDMELEEYLNRPCSGCKNALGHDVTYKFGINKEFCIKCYRKNKERTE